MTWRRLFSPVTLTLRILLVVCLPSSGYVSHDHLTNSTRYFHNLFRSEWIEIFLLSQLLGKTAHPLGYHWPWAGSIDPVATV
ncbi:hypothetical protein GGI42DRAFT_19269 [Trichoderma sp. SZMC 28013]